MSQYNKIEDILNAAKSDTITADTLDILISKTKELSAKRQQEIEELESILESLESRLKTFSA